MCYLFHLYTYLLSTTAHENPLQQANNGSFIKVHCTLILIKLQYCLKVHWSTRHTKLVPIASNLQISDLQCLHIILHLQTYIGFCLKQYLLLFFNIIKNWMFYSGSIWTTQISVSLYLYTILYLYEHHCTCYMTPLSQSIWIVAVVHKLQCNFHLKLKNAYKHYTLDCLHKQLHLKSDVLLEIKV